MISPSCYNGVSSSSTDRLCVSSRRSRLFMLALFWFRRYFCEGYVISKAPSSRGGFHNAQSYPKFASQLVQLGVTDTRTALFATRDDELSSFSSYNEEGGGFDSSSMEYLFGRIRQMRVDVLEKEMSRPPNPDLAPRDFVAGVLAALREPDDPMPDAGFRLLLRASTPQWRNLLRKAVAAPYDAEEEILASALGAAMGRPKNQFGILVGADDSEEYVITFPSDIVDFEDGTCWLECSLRGAQDNALLVMMGWQLRRRSLDGAWMIERLDWQDFRDHYRPGIGREEWMRICG